MSFGDGFNIRPVPWPPNTPVSGNTLVYNGTQWVAASASSGIPGDITAVIAGTNLNGGGIAGDITVSLNDSISLTNITASGEVSGAVGKFTTISASVGQFDGNIAIYGTAALDINPDAAYINYESSKDKVVIFPGLDVSGSSIISGNLDVVGAISASNFIGSGIGLSNTVTTIIAGTNMSASAQTGSVTLSLSSSVTNLTNIQTTYLTGTNITGSELNIDFIDFATANIANPTFQTGRLYYDIDTFDLQYNSVVNNVSFNLGQQLVVKVKNESFASINKGKLVRISGGLGNNPTIATASWENDANSANTLGMMMNTVSHNDFGYALLNGVLVGVNTNTFSPGETIYLSSSGDYTNVKPVAPKHSIKIGEVIRVGNSSVGSVFINVQNGLELEELHDVLIASASNGDLITWNSAESLWKNTSPSAIVGLNTVYAHTKFVDMSGSDSIGDGSPSKPFKTIQKAINELGYPTTPTDNKNIRHVIVNGGIYPEDILVPPVGVWKLVANGYVTLGNGSGNFLVSSTTGSIFWTNDPALEIPLSSSMRPSLTLTVGYADIYAGSTHVAYNTCGWNITGKLQISSSGVDSTTTELNLHGVRLTGQMDLSGKKGGTNVYLEKCYLANTGTQFNQPLTPGTFINYAKDCEFDGLVSVDRLDFIKNCDIGAGVKWNTWTTDGVVLNGFFGCQIAGNLSSSVGAYRADNLTRALSPTVTFSGAATTLTELSYYSASNPANWSAPAPTTVQNALDRLAAAVSSLLTGSIP